MDASLNRLTLPAPFQVMDCALTILSLGRSAQNLRELRDHLASVPAQSISHHFFDSLLRPAFDDPEYRNDFALWARRNLHDSLLAERLGVIDPTDYPDLEQLRQQLIDIVEDRLAEALEVPQAARGKEFYFLRSQFVILDTGARATSPAELAAMVPKLSTGSIFYHFIETRRRQPGKPDDFSAWLGAWGAELDEIRDSLSAVDYQLWSLSELRDQIAHAMTGLRQAQGAASA
jgi:hypothetical protein